MRISFLLFLLAVSAFAQSSRGSSSGSFINILPYRTPVSPGTIDEDLEFLSILIPAITKATTDPAITSGSRFEVETIQLVRSRKKPSRQNEPSPPTEAGLIIKGDNFLRTTREFLNWRLQYETEFIQSASGPLTDLPSTPLKQIIEATTLPRQEKITRVTRMYIAATMEQSLPMPAPTPDPHYWPVSPPIELSIPDIQVQFNLRAGKVCILKSNTNQVWFVPFPPESSPDRWIDLFTSWVKRFGIETAIDMAKKDAIRRNIPQ